MRDAGPFLAPNYFLGIHFPCGNDAADIKGSHRGFIGNVSVPKGDSIPFETDTAAIRSARGKKVHF